MCLCVCVWAEEFAYFICPNLALFRCWFVPFASFCCCCVFSFFFCCPAMSMNWQRASCQLRLPAFGHDPASFNYLHLPHGCSNTITNCMLFICIYVPISMHHYIYICIYIHLHICKCRLGRHQVLWRVVLQYEMQTHTHARAYKQLHRCIASM